jgi:hypothetical protein
VLFLGRIEAVSNSSPIDPTKWLAMIGSRESLGHIPSQMGINPFTRQPWEFKAPDSTACILVDGNRVGSISWALDDPSFLIVQAEEDSTEAVAKIADEVAKLLGGRFVLDSEAR